MAEVISFVVTGFKTLEKKLDKISTDLAKRKRINAQAVVIVDRWIQVNFQQEGKPVGGWKPLSEETILMRRRGTGSGGTRILQDTGDLRKRWKHLYDEDTAAIQSGVDYGYYHDQGKGVPKRRILPYAKEMWESLEKLYGAWIKGVLK